MHLTTKTGSSDIIFSYSNARYLNFDYLYTLSDFTDAANMYNHVQIKNITVELTRVVDEATITSALEGSAIYINQYPSEKSVQPVLDLIASNDSTYKIDTLTFDKQFLMLPVRDVSYVSSIGADPIILSTGKPMA
jgi:hypothetical protein